ncbi:MAG TPA: hypothetical protein VGH97_12300 [Thermoanaerobaculia bacterium]
MRRPVLALAVCLMGLPAAQGEGVAADAARGVVDRIAATVNDIAIPESELRKAMVVSALTPEPGEGADAFRGRVLDALIDQHLQYEDASRFGPAPPDAAQIEDAMARLRERLKAEGKDPDAEFAQAGLTTEEVRASLERQLVIARYLRERFAPIAFADEQQAREEYEKRYVPEQAAAGQPAQPFETVAEEMRKRASERAFDEEVARWLKDLRQKSRVSIYRLAVPVPSDRAATVLSAAPTPSGAAAPPPSRTPGP